MTKILKKSLACLLAFVLCFTAIAGCLAVSAEAPAMSCFFALYTVRQGKDVAVGEVCEGETIRAQLDVSNLVAGTTMGIAIKMPKGVVREDINVSGWSRDTACALNIVSDYLDEETNTFTMVVNVVSGGSYSFYVRFNVTENIPKDQVFIMNCKVEAATTSAAGDDNIYTYDSANVDQKRPMRVMTSHNVVTDAAVAATCEETGLTEGSHCSRCKKVLVAQEEVKALGHSYGEGVVDPDATCTTDGVITYTCVNGCGDSYTEAISKKGHTAADALVDNKDGTHSVVCDVCKAVIETAEHDFAEGDCACGAKKPAQGAEEDTAISVDLIINLGASINSRVIISKDIAKYANYELIISRQTVDANANLTEVKEFKFPKGTSVEEDGKVRVLGDGRGIFYYRNQISMYELGVEISYTVKCYDAAGNYVAYSKGQTKSMAQLAYDFYQDSKTTEAGKKLAIDIARAGSAVQEYTIVNIGKNNCTLQNVTSPISLFPADSTYGSVFDVTKLDTTWNAPSGDVKFNDPIVNVSTGRPAMRFIAAGLANYTQANLSAVVSYYNGKDGSNSSKTYTSDMLTAASNGRYQFIFDNIALYDTNVPLTVTLYNEGVEIATMTISLESYIAKKGTTGTAADVFKALACMGNSARDYMSMTNIWENK